MALNFWKMLVTHDGHVLVDAVLTHSDHVSSHTREQDALLARLWHTLVQYIVKHLRIKHGAEHWVFDPRPDNMVPPTPAVFDALLKFTADPRTIEKFVCWGGGVARYAEYVGTEIESMNTWAFLDLNQSKTIQSDGITVKGRCEQRPAEPEHRAALELPQQQVYNRVYQEVEHLVKATAVPFLTWAVYKPERVLVILGDQLDLAFRAGPLVDCTGDSQVRAGEVWQCFMLKTMSKDLVIESDVLPHNLGSPLLAFLLNVLMLLLSDGPSTRPTTVVTHMCGEQRHNLLSMAVSMVVERLGHCGIKIKHGVIGCCDNSLDEAACVDEPKMEPHTWNGKASESQKIRFDPTISWGSEPKKEPNVDDLTCDDFPFERWARPSMEELKLGRTGADVAMHASMRASNLITVHENYWTASSMITVILGVSASLMVAGLVIKVYFNWSSEHNKTFQRRAVKENPEAVEAAIDSIFGGAEEVVYGNSEQR